jgi:nucleotide sugar dehydrogenase
MKIGVIGAGRLGICFALLLDKAGYSIVASDVREDYVKSLCEKRIDTAEPYVQELLSSSNNITFRTGNYDVINECDVLYTLVATPSCSDGSYDVSAIWRVIADIQNATTLGINVKGKAFIVGCTTNPGDCELFRKQLEPYGVEVFYNPEFIAQGSIIKDLENADMVLVGGPEGKYRSFIEEIYNKIQVKKPKICFMSTTAAELVKLAVNCFLTTKISYANMVGEVMTLAGLENEIEQVLGAIGSDTRVGNKYLKYGYGFGGPCLPRDNRSFAAYAKKLGLEYNLGKTTDDFNNEHAKFLKNYFIGKNKEKLPFYFDYISYKKGTDIFTESQQYRLCLDLLDEGYEVYIGENKSVTGQIKDYLHSKYKNSVHFITKDNEIKIDMFSVFV